MTHETDHKSIEDLVVSNTIQFDTLYRLLIEGVPYFLLTSYPPSSTGLNFMPTMVAKSTKAVEINIIMMPRADS